MNNALRDALVIEMGDFLAQDEVFKQGWASQTGLERVLIIRNADALISRERLTCVVDTLRGERSVECRRL
jgi:hypothetical protein